MNTIAHQDLSPQEQRAAIERQIQETQFLLDQAVENIRRWTGERDALRVQMRDLERQKAQVKG